ncbi:MAG: tandem-95 repeat protein, partial [Deltaproteobacteria bacterium]
TADTYLRGLATDTNEGASSLLSVRKIGTHRLLVRFDGIGEVIGEGTLLSATLRLSVVLNGNDWGLSGRPLDLHRLLVPWSEGNGWTADNPNPTRGTGRGATWNCPDDADIANFTPDCTVPWQWESPASASVTITNDTEGSVSWDVTADVAAFLQGTPNFGWLLEKGDEAQTGLIRFASREHGGTPPPTLVITYAPPANRPPEPSAAPIVTQEDTEGTTQVFANDPDPGQTHLFAVTLPPAHGTVTIDSGGNVIYAPSLDFNGSDLFEVTVTDDATPPLSGVVAIPVTIEPVNDAPRARAPGHLVTQEDTPLSFTIEVEDPDVGQSHLFTLQMPPLDGEVSVDSAGNVTYTPNPGFFGVDGFGIEVRDDDPSPLSEVVTTSVTVVERNDPPQPQAAPIVTQEDTPATSQLFANDPNSEQAHTYTISSPPLHGTASIDPSGLVTYDPASDFTGSDEIGVRVTDDGTPPLWEA